MTMWKEHKHQPVQQATVRYNMKLELSLIAGIMLGFEYVKDEYDDNYLVIDILFARILIGWQSTGLSRLFFV